MANQHDRFLRDYQFYADAPRRCPLHRPTLRQMRHERRAIHRLLRGAAAVANAVFRGGRREWR